MSYGEFLAYCRRRAGIVSKSEFARKLGILSVNHYIGAENDRESRKPSLDLIERAAKLGGLEFQDFINPPTKRKFPPQDDTVHRQLQALLDRDDEVSDWIIANISVFYHRFFGGADDAEIESHRKRQSRPRK